MDLNCQYCGAACSPDRKFCEGCGAPDPIRREDLEAHRKRQEAEAERAFEKELERKKRLAEIEGGPQGGCPACGGQLGYGVPMWAIIAFVLSCGACLPALFVKQQRCLSCSRATGVYDTKRLKLGVGVLLLSCCFLFGLGSYMNSEAQKIYDDAILKIDAGQYDAARTQLDAYIAHSGSNEDDEARAHLLLGYMDFEQGNTEGARSHFRTAVELDPMVRPSRGSEAMHKLYNEIHDEVVGSAGNAAQDSIVEPADDGDGPGRSGRGGQGHGPGGADGGGM